MGLLDFFKALLGISDKKKKPLPGGSSRNFSTKPRPIVGRTGGRRKKKAGPGRPSSGRRSRPVKKTDQKGRYAHPRRSRSGPAPRRKPSLAVRRNVPSARRKPVSGKEKEIGTVIHYFSNISVGVIKLKVGIKRGDTIRIKGAHDDFTQAVTSMQINHKDIEFAPPGKEVGLKVVKRIHLNDTVFKVAG